MALEKEFKAKFSKGYYDIEHYENIALWRKYQYDYNLSEEAFSADIQEPLRLSEDEKIPSKYKNKINNSILSKIIIE